MSKYNNNNYFRSSGTDESPMRFMNNKRPRYDANNSPRFSQTNPSSYNYQQNNRNIASPSSGGPYQNNTQYERSPRNYYGRGSVTKRPLHKQQQPLNFERQNHQASPTTFSNVSSRTIAALSPSPIAVGNATNRTTLPPPPIQQTTPHAVNNRAATIGNQQQHSGTTTIPLNIPDQTFAYNNYFYPNYNTDTTESPTSSSAYGMNYNISQYMWQTITSTPPPNLLQPPLPQQSPPTKLPPLPGADMSSPPPTHLQPPPAPHASLLTMSSSVLPDYRQDKSNDSRNLKASKPVVKMKVKRKAMSSRYNTSKNWSQEDAELALKAEEDITINQQKDTILVLRFPDPDINRDVVRSYSPAIESVHFQLNFAPRYCFVHLKPGTNVKETIETLSKIPFGSGFLKAEVKDLNMKPRNTKPCDIDPCTLYVGNLPTTIACTVLKEHFPGASRIDIGFAQRMKYTRYAFIRYPNVQQSIEAYKRMSHAEISGRSLLLRFRRTGTQRDDSKDDDLAGDEYSIDDYSLPQSGTSPATGLAENEDENSIQLSQSSVDINETNAQINVNSSNGATDDTNLNGKDNDNDARNHGNIEQIKETNQEVNNESNQQAETIENNSNIRTENHEVSTNSTVPFNVQNIKPDPDIDPDDIVVGNEDITSRFDYNDHRVKQEKEKVTDFEFFAPADDQPNGSTRNSIMNDVTSLSTTTTEASDDTNDDGHSLGEFLTTCQRAETPKEDHHDHGLPATKIVKTMKTLMEKEIKNEPIEEISSDLQQTTQPKSGNESSTTTIKQEFLTMNEDLTNKSIEDVCNVDILPEEDNFLQSIIMDKTKELNTISKGSSKNTANLKIHSPISKKDNLNSAKTLRLENESQLNNNKEKTNSTKQKSSLKAKSSPLLVNSAKHNLPKDNDDLVPTSALFLRTDNESSANEMYDDEFFATKSQKLTQNTLESPLRDVKQEPLESVYPKTTKTSSYSPAEKPRKQPNKECNKTKSKDPTKSLKASLNKSNVVTNKPTISLDDDDLVPADNCLLSRQSLSQMDFGLTASLTTPEIKMEKEFDDLFSTPFKKTYQERISDKSTNVFRQQPSNNNNNSNDFLTSFGDTTNLNVNDKENSSDNSSTDTLKSKSSIQNLQNSQKQISHDFNNGANEYDELSEDDEDDDLIIISENFPPISKPTIRTSSSVESNFLGQSELLTFKHIPSTTTDYNSNSLYATIHESSRKLQHHDNLDKLFQQLDSDSDSEL